jgi:hypothetical protein
MSTSRLNRWSFQRALRKNELAFCSRKAPLTEEFNTVFTRGKFREKLSDVGFVLSHQLREDEE